MVDLDLIEKSARKAEDHLTLVLIARIHAAEACADKLREALDALGKLYNEVTAVQKLRTGHHDMWPSEVEPGRLIREAREAHDRMREGRK